MTIQTFNFIGETIQTFIVPPGVSTITVRVVGAGGGIGKGGGINPGGGTGGLPASVQGEFSVAPGQTLSIIVGERGHNAHIAGTGGGGGGGSFIWSGTVDNLLIAAGGGGGAGYSSPPDGNGLDANFNNGNGVWGSGGGIDGGIGGIGGSGGAGFPPDCGSGGAGVFGNGGSAILLFSEGGRAINDPVNPGRGGSSDGGGSGGYGGGGGGGLGGGGGGGYSGGGGGSDGGGGGGGSMNNGVNPVNLLSSNTGNGLVEISYEAVITRGVPF